MTRAATVSHGRPLAELIDHEARRRRRRRIVRWSFVALLPALVAVAVVAARPRPVPLSAQFRDEIVRVGSLTREVRATGRVEAVTTVRVGAEVSGRVDRVEVDFNDRVHAGQVLAVFDGAVLEAQLEQGRAALAVARANLQQAGTDRGQAQRNLARAEQLRATEALSARDADAARTAARIAEQRLQAARSQVAAQRAANDLIRTNLDHTVIRSPIDGMVITREIDPGQTVASVLQTPVLFTVAADLREMRVVAPVDEADIGHVQTGQTASFSVTAYPDRRFLGVVTEVRNAPEVVQNVVTYGAVVAVDNDDLALKPGMTASVRIQTATARDALLVPTTALHFTPPGRSESETPGVWVIEDGRLRRRAVRTGISDGVATVIEPGSVTAGERVLVELTPAGRVAHGIGP